LLIETVEEVIVDIHVTAVDARVVVLVVIAVQLGILVGISKPLYLMSSTARFSSSSFNTVS